MSWLIIAFISAMLSAASAITQKKILFSVDALRFSLMVSLFGCLFSLPFLLTVNFSAITAMAVAVLFIKSLLGSFAFFYVMQSIRNLELSGALPLMALTPGLVAIFAFIILGESLSGFEIAGIVLLASGTYLLETKGKAGLAEPFRVFVRSRNHHYVLIALSLFTITSILDKMILKNYRLQPEAFLVFQQFFFLLVFAVTYYFTRRSDNICSGYNRNILLLIITVAVLTIGYRYTQVLAFRIAPIAVVLAVKRISVLFAVVIGGRIFKEHDLLKKTIATIIIIIGAILISEE